MKTPNKLQELFKQYEPMLVKIKDITPYARNAKKHDKVQIANVAESIKQFGFVQPLVLDKNNVVVIGHCRLSAAKKLGLSEVPCIIVDLDDEEVAKLRNLDNKLNESEWDFDLLAEDIDGLDFDGFDIDWGLPEDEERIEVEEDEPPEVDEVEHRCEPGDIWQLGDHRLMCGDSTDPGNLEKLMGGCKADLVFTDPPYGMKKEAEGIINDNLNYDDLLAFNKRWIPLSFGALKENGSWYCWGIDEPLMDIYSVILKPMERDKKITFRNLITWDKGHGQGQNAEDYRMYAIADEKCLFVMKGEQMYGRDKSTWFDGFEPFRAYMVEECKKIGLTISEVCKMTNSYAAHCFSKSQYGFPTEKIYNTLKAYAKNEAFKREYEAFKREYEAVKREYEAVKDAWYSTRAFFDNTHDNMNNVWHFERTAGAERAETGGHATPKPLKLCERAIKTSSRKEETVLDLFGGSGSTLIACEQLGRKCCTMELDPKYCDVILTRWENLTGNQAKKIN